MLYHPDMKVESATRKLKRWKHAPIVEFLGEPG